MSEDWRCEIIDCRPDNRVHKTGKGTAHPTEIEARNAFEKAVAVSVDIDTAPFIVDLHDNEGTIVDNVGIDEAGFAALIGEKPGSVEEYAAYDATFWQDALAQREKLA